MADLGQVKPTGHGDKVGKTKRLYPPVLSPSSPAWAATHGDVSLDVAVSP